MNDRSPGVFLNLKICNESLPQFNIFCRAFSDPDNLLCIPCYILKSQGKNVKTTQKLKAKVAPKGVAQSRLTLTKHLTVERSLPRRPLLYAAKNMYYDEKWMEKQERGKCELFCTR